MRAAIYLRQSKDREGNELAVDRQREDLLKLCAARGWSTASTWTTTSAPASGCRASRLMRSALRCQYWASRNTFTGSALCTQEQPHPQPLGWLASSASTRFTRGMVAG
jgi:hypothetical protein